MIVDRDDHLLTILREQFTKYQWNHTEDSFQSQFDTRRPLKAGELKSLRKLLDLLHRGGSDDSLSELLRKEINSADGDLMAIVLQIVGSTRNKILTDLRAMSGSNDIQVPSSYKGLAGNSKAWTLAGPYLAVRLRTVLTPLLKKTTESALECLNQATYPGYIRQQRAKLQGHEAEYRLATLLAACGIPFEPKEKAENPLCRDAQVEGESYDLVIPSVSAPMVCVKATVHTSNIGQYGESKDYLEVVQAIKSLERKFGPSRPTLLVLIDGVGFRSNRAGLDGVLMAADEFCQFRTIWKAVVVCASKLGKQIKIQLPTEIRAEHLDFLTRHNYQDLVVGPGVLDPANIIQGGDAMIERV